LPWTLLGELIALPDPLAGLNIPYFYGEAKGRKVETPSPSIPTYAPRELWAYWA